MKQIKKLVLLFNIKLCMILLSLMLSACTTVMQDPVLEQQQPQVAELNSSRSEKGWYAVRFSIPWEQGVAPEWYIGTLIAGEIISPFLGQSLQKIICWRIHRRAVHDKTGHVFSFIFYSSQTDAAMIYQLFQNNKLLVKLHQQLLVKVAYDSLYNNSQTTIADTSDTIWPEKIRSTWPFFMMGASQMWLEQIRAFKKETLNEPEMKQRYLIIQSKITDLWQQQGKHALLHHLSALYAYQPVLVRF